MTISKTPLVLAWIRDLQIDEKYEYLLTTNNWRLDSTGRPKTDNKKRQDGTRKFDVFGNSIFLHQLVMYLEYGKKSNMKIQVRHLNHDVLDNRLENLSFGSARDNKLDHEKNTGVRLRPSGKWCCVARLGGKTYNGRLRETRELAQFDYDMVTALHDYHGILPKERIRELPEYVYRVGSPTKPYLVQKRFAARTVRFGTYCTIEEAVSVRDNLIANNWIK